MIAIDTNVLLRFLFKPVDNNNPKWQVDVAEALINKPDKVFISGVVIAETEWVLESVFECNRQEIYSVIHELASRIVATIYNGCAERHKFCKMVGKTALPTLSGFTNLKRRTS